MGVLHTNIDKPRVILYIYFHNIHTSRYILKSKPSKRIPVFTLLFHPGTTGTPGVKPKDKLRPEALSPTHLKHMLVKLDHEPQVGWKYKKYLKAAPKKWRFGSDDFPFQLGDF